MEPKDLEELKIAVANAASEATAITITQELGQYKVPKEQHYQDHLWINQMITWQNNIKSSIWKSIMSILVAAIFMLMVWGFIMWGKQNISGGS